MLNYYNYICARAGDMGIEGIGRSLLFFLSPTSHPSIKSHFLHIQLEKFSIKKLKMKILSESSGLLI
jgi:hypothetical protein